jgi:orotate phosphoribosyltransferase
MKGHDGARDPERVSFGSLAKALHDMGALRLGEFTLPNGNHSLYDIDLRLVPSYPEIYTTVLAAYVELVEGVGTDSYDAIAGVATAGVTISSPLAVMLKKPMMYVRKEGESRGQDRFVEGVAPPHSRVLMIDDLVSTGRSVVSAAGALRRLGFTVTDAAVLVDRMEGGKENLASAGLRLNSYATIEQLLRALCQMNLAKEVQVDAVLHQAEARRRQHRP